LEVNVLTKKYVEDSSVHKRYLGFRSSNGARVAGDMKCQLCGKWFSWSTQNELKYCMENRWDIKRQEPKHCGSKHCYDYQARYEVHLAKMQLNPDYHKEMSWKVWKRRQSELERKTTSLFYDLQKRGLIA